MTFDLVEKRLFFFNQIHKNRRVKNVIRYKKKISPGKKKTILICSSGLPWFPSFVIYIMCEEMYYWMHQNENTLWIPDSGAFFTSFSPNHSPVNWENTSQINQWWKQSLAAALNPVPLYLPSFSRPFKCQARRDWWDAEGGTRTDKFHRLPHHVRRETKGWGFFFCLMWLKNSHDCEISWKKKMLPLF